MYATALTLARQGRRRGGDSVVAMPMLRAQSEQITFLDMRWVNLPLAPFGEDDNRRAERQQVARLIRDFQPDLIHAYGIVGVEAAAAAVGRGVPLVATLSDLGKRHLSRAQRGRLRRALRRCQAVTVSAAEELAALARVDRRLAARAQLIHAPAEVKPVTADFDLGRKRRTLGLRSETAVVGVVSPATLGLGLESVLAAAAAITRDFHSVEFLFVGDGPDQEALMLRAHAAGIGGAVVFRGDRADLPEIIACLNILVVPREIPGSLASVLQALAVEVPVVAVRTPALAGILEPVDPAAFVPPDDAEALAGMLARRLEILPPPDDDAYAEMGIGFSRSEMLVSGLGFDLDEIGLEAQTRGDESQRQAVVRQAQRRLSLTAVVAAMEGLYEQVLTG
jgi:glycosyltransferase involved in cell wall biosynthesis